MSRPQRLSAKLVGIQIFALVVALASIGSTLLCRGAWKAARPRSTTPAACACAPTGWHTSRRSSGGASPDPRSAADRTGDSRLRPVVATLRHGDPVRPLFVPDTAAIASDFAAFDRGWAALRPKLERVAAGSAPGVTRPEFERFVGVVDRLVVTLERDIAQTTSLLRGIQLALVALAIAGAVALIYLAFLFIIRPVHQLEEACSGWPRANSRCGCRSSRRTSSARSPAASTTWRSTCRSRTGRSRGALPTRRARWPSRTRGSRRSTT